MSKELFKDAVEAAREIQKVTRPYDQGDGPARLPKEVQSQVGELVEKAREAMTQAAEKGDFGSVEEARLALRALSGGDYDALRSFAERNMPVNDITRHLAGAIAPGRSATLAAFKKSPFGSPFSGAASAKGALKSDSIAEPQEADSDETQRSLRLGESDEKKASRAEAARALEEKTLREQNQSFQSLARAFGKGLPASKADAPSIAAAPGMKMVEGARQAAEPMAQLPAEARAKKEAAEARAVRAASGKKLSAKEEFELAQFALFDASSAPLPVDAEQKRGRGRPRKNKAM